MNKESITQPQLKKELLYNPDTGIFTWKKTGSGRRKDLIAGYINTEKYLCIQVRCQKFKAHRLAFLYMEGKLPPDQVDHIDHVRHNNKWENLRHATHSENMRNKVLSSRNTSGVSGISWDKNAKKWSVTMRHEGKVRFARHRDWFEAVCARKSLESKYAF